MKMNSRFLDTLQMALTAHCVYFYLVTHATEPDFIVTHPVVWCVDH